MQNSSIQASSTEASWKNSLPWLIKGDVHIGQPELSLLKKEIEVLPDIESTQFLPVFVAWLQSAFQSSAFKGDGGSSLREAMLDCMSLLPGLGEPLKPFLNDIMNLLIAEITEDNETNALVAMHIFVEFHKVFRSAVEGSVQPFIDFVLRLMEAFPSISTSILQNSDSRSASVPGHSPSSKQSVKILVESPVMVVLLFQLHRKFINDNILKFVPLIIKILEISLPAPEFIVPKASDDLSAISGQVKSPQRQSYCDFIQAKVKVLSFVAYVSRSFSSALKVYQNSIPTLIIDLLKNSPPESASARKELLVAIRHILATDLRQAFISQFEVIFNDDLLFGIGYTSNWVMRPLVFSTIADLVHHIRLDLSPKMIVRVIEVYSRCFHDSTLPFGIQTMSAKLLLNLMDCINSEKMDLELRRPLSMKILSILLLKYKRLARIIEEVNVRRFDSSNTLGDKGFDIYWEDPWKCRMINSDVISADCTRDNTADIKFILKTITAGVKSIILSFKTNYIPSGAEKDSMGNTAPMPANSFMTSCNFALEESKLFIDMFRHGVSCFDICQTERPSSKKSNITAVTSISAEDKELVDQFAYIFTLLDPYIFQDVISTHIEFLFEKIIQNPLLLIIPQYFLAINTVSRNFSGILIKFLMDKFECVWEINLQGHALLRLFKLIFLAVSVYPDDNEQMILPYISDIIVNCLRFSQQAENPQNYFLVLKALFRGIAGGRFEHLYKEVLPILPLLLETLNKLAITATDRQMQDLYVELCLTTPVRLSVLLPYLPFLMKPLVLALVSETELVNQGLRTLELCVDNLTQDFLEPILAPVLPQLMDALWALLRQGSENSTHSQFALRILGKFGGRGRRFLKYPLKLDYVESKDPSFNLVYESNAENGGLLELPLDTLIDLCHDYFRARTVRQSGENAETYSYADLFFILSSCLSAFCGFDISQSQSFDSKFLNYTSLSVDNDLKLAFDEPSIQARLKNIDLKPVNCISAEASAKLFKKLIVCLFHATLQSAAEHGNGSARAFLNNICDRFVVIQILIQRNQAKDYSFSGLTPNLILEVLAEFISGPNEELSNLALSLLSRIHEILKSNLPVDKIPELPLFFLLMEKLISYCYGSEFHRKIGACRGLGKLCGFDLGLRWMWIQESRILRGLLYILKDMPAFVSEGQVSQVTEVLLTVLRICHPNKPIEDNDLKSKQQYYFNQIMTILISELTNSNKTVRSAVHASFELLSECNGCEVGELLSPYRDRLLLPIFTKPLRALPFTLQIGYVDAVDYCLNLKPPLVTFSEELLRLLHEALALVEADDTALASKTGQLKNASNLINLRVVCISLLSNAISCAEFQDPKMHQIRNHIVSAFFKSLYSKSSEIVAVARNGLETVILHQQKLPKDLLQHGLRPVLINLAEAKRLTLSGLDGLSKVLQLLTSYFKAEIGKKLLDHITIWADQKLLEDLNSKPLLESMEVKVIVAILNIFHLLPPSANLFLEELVSVVSKLDLWTKRTLSSPFRPPLYRFMCKHPSDSVAFLFANPENQLYCDVFLAVVKSDHGLVLLEELKKPENGVALLKLLHGNEDRRLPPRGIRLSTLAILCAVVRSANPLSDVFDLDSLKSLLSTLISTNNAQPIDCTKEEESEQALELIFILFSRKSVDSELFFNLMTVMETPGNCIDVTWVPKRIRENLIVAAPDPLVKELTLTCIEAMNSSQWSLNGKAKLIRYFLLPLFASLKSQDRSILDLMGSGFASKLDKAIFSRPNSEIIQLSHALSLEELQLACLLISMESPSDLKGLYPPIRRFIIAKNASPDPVIRYSALFAASFFIGETGQELNLLSNLFKSSLSIPTSEVRPLLRQILAYTFPHLLHHSDPAFLRSWLSGVLEDLSKNSHFLTVVSVFWSNLIQFEESLVAYREILIRPLILCLVKAAMSVLSVADSRSIPIEIAKMILKWLQSMSKSFKLTADICIDQFTHVLVKMIMVTNDNSSDSKSLSLDALSLLQDLVKFFKGRQWPYKIRHDYFVKSLPPINEVNDDSINSSILFVKILTIVADGRDDEAFIADCESLQRFIHFTLTACNEKLVREVLPLFSRLCRSRKDKFDELFMAINYFLNDSLQNSRALNCTFLILNSIQANSDEDLGESIISSFLRAFQKICRDHVGEPTMTNPEAAAKFTEETRSTLIPALDFANSILITLPPASKTIAFSFFRLLWEQSTSAEVMRVLLEIVKAWFSPTSDLADLKDKAEVITTPSKLFDIQDDSLMEIYLVTILAIYSSPRLSSTDLTVKLEGSFLYGLCYGKKAVRRQFFDLIDSLVPRKVDIRLLFVFSSQRWNLVASSYWISFALEFIVAAWPVDSFVKLNCLTWPQFSTSSSAAIEPSGFNTMLSTFSECLNSSPAACHSLWLQVFPQLWNGLSEPLREELLDNFVKIFADPDFIAASLSRPNALKTILDALALLPHPLNIPNNVVSYVGSQYGAWYSACHILETNLSSVAEDRMPKSHDYGPVKDLCHLYDKLGETEMNEGLLRRFAVFPETNIALSFEQSGQWITAQKLLEKSQLKARNGTIPFFEDEYIVWESHWEQCAKKLQQWDLLAEVAKVDSNINLALECEWVLNDWSRNETKTHIDVLLGQIKEDSRQKKLMESFMILNQLKDSSEKLSQFQSSLDSILNDVMNGWAQLPNFPTKAHCSALEQLQIIVELQESQSFFVNSANSMNRPQFLQELKALLSTWRDRLPNKWEDPAVWSGLLAWRQHVFTAINSVFHNPNGAGSGASNIVVNSTVAGSDGVAGGAPSSSTTHPFAYRGHHETAWLINRFAHIARKNGLFDVSLSFLNKIYTLPNIEIQDAFLKLREQAKCYMESPNELPTALEVINATNLNYFNNNQKAEFFTLKAVVLSRLGMIEEANRIFAQAVQIDLNIAKGWSSWGYFNDQRFQQSKDITFGVNAVNCYLQAATLCKNANARKYLTRVLWLLTFEDAAGSMSKSFELYNHDLPSWYWVPFIPELLSSLMRSEARQARFLLMKIAKSYPQALYLQLRTANEEYKLMNSSPTGSATPIQSGESIEGRFNATVAASNTSPNQSIASELSGLSPNDNIKSSGEAMDIDSNVSSSAEVPFLKKPPHEHAEDLIGILKTGYPLLALSLENMIEHIIHRLRSSPEEDLLRIITTLITENLQQTMIKLNANLGDQTPSPLSVLEGSLKKVSEMLSGSVYLSQKFKSAFENDFLRGDSSLSEIMERLMKWQRQLSLILDKLPTSFHLENFSRYLAEFEHQRYDDVDVPGQYLALRDTGSEFVKLERFDSQVEIVRRHGTSFRRIVMIGNDGSRTTFIVQNPSSRQSRREERLVQLLRMADSIVDKKIVSKRHSLTLNPQVIVPLSAFVRLIQDHESFVSLEDVYELHCRQVNIQPEDPILYFRDCMFKSIESLQIPFKKGSVDLLNMRVDLFEEICQKFIPANILSNYLISIYPDFGAYWNFRSKFTSYYASFVFISYVLAIGHRFPHKIGFNRESALLIAHDLLPTLNQSGQFTLTEAVPFRLTPNLQHFITEIGISGPFTTYVISLGQALAGKKQDLSNYLMLYLRDEIITWASGSQGASALSSVGPDEPISLQSDLATKILQNVEIIMKRVQTLACSKEFEKGAESLQPIDQSVLDLISCAANPQKLAHMDSHWLPWL